MSQLNLHDESESAWILAFLVMPMPAREAWRTLADKVGVDLRSPTGDDFQRLTEHHRRFPADPAIEQIVAMGREEVQRRSN